jgi:hypothetical protein
VSAEQDRGTAAGRRLAYARARGRSADQLASDIAARAPLAAVSGRESTAELRMLRRALELHRAGRPLVFRARRSR